MIIFLLSIALWFLCGVQAFAIFVRRMANSEFTDPFDSSFQGAQPAVRLKEGRWQVRWGSRWESLGFTFIIHTGAGLWALGWRVIDGHPIPLLNLGFRFVAKDIIPLEIARKLEDKKPPVQPPTSWPTSSAQLQGLNATALATQAGLTQATQLSLGLIQPPQQP